VAPVYTDVTAFITSMGFSDSRKQILLAVVRADGNVLAHTEGGFNATQAHALMAVLINGPRGQLPLARGSSFAEQGTLHDLGWDQLRLR
jgi:hypothetical protein